MRAGCKRVSPRVIRQVNGSELVEIMFEQWVFIPPFGHVTELVGHVANTKILLARLLELLFL